jgi:hypothetical protein
MPSVELSEQAWGQLMSLLADAPWKVANPLLMEIGNQLRQQHQPPINQTAPPGGGIRLDANGKEIRNE